MQGTLVREFLHVDCAEAIVFQQGLGQGEAYDWATKYWSHHHFENEIIWDDAGLVGTTWNQPNTGIPFGRHFIVDQAGLIADPFFGHDPQATMERIYGLYGGDCDADGLHDAWEVDHFGDLLQDPSGDPDGDGVSNGQEFNDGTDPTGELEILIFHAKDAAGANHLTFEAHEAEWYFAGLTRYYAVEVTTDPWLGTWTDVPGHDRLSGSGWQDLVMPRIGPREFYRVRTWLE